MLSFEEEGLKKVGLRTWRTRDVNGYVYVCMYLYIIYVGIKGGLVFVVYFCNISKINAVVIGDLRISDTNCLLSGRG